MFVDKMTTNRQWYDKEFQLALDTKNKFRLGIQQCPNNENIKKFYTRGTIIII